MNMIDSQLANAVKNLDSLSKTASPKAAAMAINRVAKRATSRSVRDTAKTVKIPAKIIRPRAKMVKATAKRPVAYVNVRRFDVPAISIGTARTQIRRQRGQFMVSRMQRGRNGRYAKREMAGNTSIRVGRHRFDNAFLQRLKNGRWHIMQRTSDARYPIKVCKVPIAKPLTRHFTQHSRSLMQTDMKKELRQALNRQAQLVIKRRIK